MLEVPTASPRPAGRWHAEQKAIAETAMLLWFVAPVRDANKEIAERLHAAVVRLVPLARNEGVLGAICADPGQADAYAVAHVVLQRMGFPDHGFDEVLLASWGSSATFQARTDAISQNGQNGSRACCVSTRLAMPGS